MRGKDRNVRYYFLAGIQNASVKAATRLRVKKLPDKQVHNGKSTNQVAKSVVPAEAPQTNNNTHNINNNIEISLESNDTIKSLQEAVHFRPLSTQRSVSSEDTNDTNSIGKMATNGDDSDGEPRSLFQGISLKDFERHRKMVEEQNKQKKEMLTRAIEQR